MSTGAQRAEAQPEDGIGEAGATDWLGTAVDDDPEGAAALAGEETAPARAGRKVLASLLILLGLGWIGVAGWTIAQSDLSDAPRLLSGIALATGPLILLGLLWLIFGRTQRRETERFLRAVTAMRSESQALENILAIVATRLEENHGKLRGEAAKLMSLGDEASDRLGRVAHYLSKESANLDRKSEALEAAAAAARVDIGVLLQDLPRAEEQARAVAEAMRDAGMSAHSQAGALEGQLSALLARGREADEVVGGAAQRLAAHLARIESTADVAATRMNDASEGMKAAIDSSMERASEAVDAARAGLDAQSAAMLAMIEQSQAAFDRAGEDAGRSLSLRLEKVGSHIETLASQLAAQDAASHALLSSLAKELGDLEARFAELERNGAGNADQLGRSIGAVRDSLGLLSEDLSGGHERANGLIHAAGEMTQALQGVAIQLNGELPAAFLGVEEQSDRIRKAIQAVAPDVAAMEVSASNAAGRLDAAAQEAARFREAVEASGATLSEHLAGQLKEVEERIASLRETGEHSSTRLDTAVSALRASVGELAESLSGGEARAGELAARARETSEALASISAELETRMPAALADVEERAARTAEAASAMAPTVQAIQTASDQAASRLAEAEASLVRQQQALDALLAKVAEGVGTAEANLVRFQSAAQEADDVTSRIVSQTGPELIDSLMRVRDAANQAAERAREAISAVIPQSAAALAEASRDAVSNAIRGPIEQQIGALGEVAERALDTARAASERLTRQMLKIGETAAAVERRIDEARGEREAQESENVSRRVALLIESLNSTAIDVTKILSNEVTDSAWAAYLKGDRGVFTRRAVRLLDNAEAREILQHYENEPEFREQVNRYIHDFEAMLRRILADKDSSALGVTILSSDMGKLYVALAQAIQRLRN